MSSSISSATSSSTASASSSAAAGLHVGGNSSFKIVGIALAVGSGFLIGTSFVIKKKGLINSTKKYGNVAGEGHAYLKSWLWWAGMITMIIGEICNFVAYAFTEAILVTPMGALSVVVAAILSHFLLKEKLTFFGWIGCTLCIMGAVILALNAPEQQSVTTINEFKRMFLSVGFLVWAGILIAASLVVAFYVAPRWGKKSMLPYISICSLIGGISVSCTQGLGSSIVTSIQGNNQVKNWFFWFLFVFVVVTLLIEINYLNKALELFNTSMVVPVYFCFFSSATLITSFILYQGLKASAVTLITMVLGFLVTCLGITLLQLSKVDPQTLDKLDRKSTILMTAAKHQTEDAEKGEVSAAEDPGMDALRGGFGAVGSIIRARSVSRRMSNASSMGGGKMYSYSSGNLSTHGMGNVQRFQLSDTPMPADAMDQISLHSAKSPSTIFPPGFHSGHSYFPQRSKSGLKASSSPSLPSSEPSPRPTSPKPISSPDSTESGTEEHILLQSMTSLESSTNAMQKALADSEVYHEQFEEADVVHQYHYGTAPDEDATHTYRLHGSLNIPPDQIGPNNAQYSQSSGPGMGQRQMSTGAVYPPKTVQEEDEEYDEKSDPRYRSKSEGYGLGLGSGSGSRTRSRVEEVGGYSDPYSDLHPYSQDQNQNHNQPRGSGGMQSQPSHKGLSGLFQFHSGPDLSFNVSKSRRGSKSPSGGRDRSKSGDKGRDEKHEYPNLTKREKRDEIEREERVGLVDSIDADADLGESGSASGSEGGGMTLESSTIGHGDREGDQDSTAATIGVGTRINLGLGSHSSQPSWDADANSAPGSQAMPMPTPAPASARTAVAGGVSAPRGGGRGSRTVAGPRYQ